jgi:hypothetical protein
MRAAAALTTTTAPFLAALILGSPPIAAAQVYEDKVTPVLMDKAPQPILPAPPVRLRWDAPEGGSWVSGEVPPVAPGPTGEIASIHGSAMAGMRHSLINLPGLSWNLAPSVRLEAAGDSRGMAFHPGFDAAFTQEVTASLPRNLQLNLTGSLEDRFGISASTPAEASAGSPAVRAQLAVSSAVGTVAGAPARLELQLAMLRPVDRNRSPMTSLCELKLNLTRAGAAPVWIAGSCPGTEGEQRVTIGISGRF